MYLFTTIYNRFSILTSDPFQVFAVAMAVATASERAYGYDGYNGMDSHGYQMPANYGGHANLAYAPYHVSRRARRSPSPQQQRGGFAGLLNEFKRIELEFFGGLKGLFFPRG